MENDHADIRNGDWEVVNGDVVLEDDCLDGIVSSDVDFVGNPEYLDFADIFGDGLGLTDVDAIDSDGSNEGLSDVDNTDTEVVDRGGDCITEVVDRGGDCISDVVTTDSHIFVDSGGATDADARDIVPANVDVRSGVTDVAVSEGCGIVQHAINILSSPAGIFLRRRNTESVHRQRQASQTEEDRLTGYEKLFVVLGKEGKSLILDVERDISDFSNKVGFITGLSILSFIASGVVSCTVGVVIAVVHIVLLFLSFLPVLYVVWCRVITSYNRMLVLRGKLGRILDSVEKLGEFYSGSPPIMSTNRTIQIMLPPSPNKVLKVDFKSQLARLKKQITSDVLCLKLGWAYYMYLAILTVFCIVYSIGVPYIFYLKFCPVVNDSKDLVRSWFRSSFADVPQCDCGGSII